MHIKNPTKITQGSFTIIQRELSEAGHHFPPSIASVIERIIHSTADFDFAHLTQFSQGAVESGVQALKRGCPVVTDVNMVRIGIGAQRLAAFGGSLHCFVAEPETRQRAVAEGDTRSALGMRISWEQGLIEDGIAVVGNAPTAVYELIDLIEKYNARPALVVGVPVGFVSTVECKEALMEIRQIPWIVTQGRKGGSPVAVAIVNALLRLAAEAPATETD